MLEPMVVTGGFEPIRTASLVDEAHRQIRAQVLNGELRPGDPLRDSVLAEQMGISRSPVREALRLLEQSGLVEKAANRSYRISLPAAADVPELAALRAADEVLAVRFIVKNRSSLTSLDAVIQRLRDAEDAVEAAAADAAFHAEAVALAGLPRLSARYADLTDQIRLVLMAGGLEQEQYGDQLVENHVELRDALQGAIDSGSTRELVPLWESHVLAGMAAPQLFEPR
jgi:DNA-binding GntR family transcriptional regulator